MAGGTPACCPRLGSTYPSIWKDSHAPCNNGKQSGGKGNNGKQSGGKGDTGKDCIKDTHTTPTCKLPQLKKLACGL